MPNPALQITQALLGIVIMVSLGFTGALAPDFLLGIIVSKLTHFDIPPLEGDLSRLRRRIPLWLFSIYNYSITLRNWLLLNEPPTCKFETLNGRLWASEDNELTATEAGLARKQTYDHQRIISAYWIDKRQNGLESVDIFQPLLSLIEDQTAKDWSSHNVVPKLRSTDKIEGSQAESAPPPFFNLSVITANSNRTRITRHIIAKAEKTASVRRRRATAEKGKSRTRSACASYQ
jgi:hypothetical protein